MSEELKPCPFCGGEVELSDIDEPNAYFNCINCTKGILVHNISSEQEAIKAWNTREGK